MSFTKLISTEQGKLEFHFEDITTSSGQRFHLTVNSPSGGTYHFTMSLHDSSTGNGLWKIIDAPHPPEWIFKLEPQLCQAILENT